MDNANGGYILKNRRRTYPGGMGFESCLIFLFQKGHDIKNPDKAKNNVTPELPAPVMPPKNLTIQLEAGFT